MIDDVEKQTVECRSVADWKAVNLCYGRKVRFMICMYSELINDMKLTKVINHYAAVLHQAPSDNLVRDSSELSPLTNKSGYSFTVLNIRSALKKSILDTSPGSDCVLTDYSNYVSWKKMY